MNLLVNNNEKIIRILKKKKKIQKKKSSSFSYISFFFLSCIMFFFLEKTKNKNFEKKFIFKEEGRENKCSSKKQSFLEKLYHHGNRNFTTCPPRGTS
jgi:hypothetical protein